MLPDNTQKYIHEQARGAHVSKMRREIMGSVEQNDVHHDGHTSSKNDLEVIAKLPLEDPFQHLTNTWELNIDVFTSIHGS